MLDEGAGEQRVFHGRSPRSRHRRCGTGRVSRCNCSQDGAEIHEPAISTRSAATARRMARVPLVVVMRERFTLALLAVNSRGELPRSKPGMGTPPRFAGTKDAALGQRAGQRLRFVDLRAGPHGNAASGQRMHDRRGRPQHIE